MGVTVFPAPVAATTIYQPIDSAGTYTLSTPLTAGAYAITGDSAQTLTFTLINALGYTFQFTLRGGRGRAYIPAAVTSIIAPAGTYPINLGFEKMTITLPTTPTATFAWNANPSGNAAGKFTFTAPAGTVSTRIYWEDGTNEALTSGADIIAKPFVTTSGQTRSVAIVHKNAIGLESAAQILTTSASLANLNILQLTSSGTWTVPAGLTSVDAVIVAGGGGGGTGGNSSGYGAGAGGGGVIISTGISVTPGATMGYTIGAGGTANPNSAAGNGGNTVFASLTAVGGGAGGNAAASPRNGSAGGSGGGGAGGFEMGTGAAGTAGQGNAGGNSVNGQYNSAGGGGGYAAAGTNSNGSTPGTGGQGYNLANFASTLSGFVGSGSGGTASGGGGTSGGNAGTSVQGSSGFTAGTANRGGGGGASGQSGYGVGAGAGGSGVIILKYSI